MAQTVDAASADNREALARKLSKPIASLISVPFQFNHDCDLGPEDKGERYLLNFQPVIPVSLGATGKLSNGWCRSISWCLKSQNWVVSW
ncbi:hypothetical protein SAMN02745866_01806 [Alteromonadaceae bacterium Bs31]|nr:hypothetical protein SAMN02745866_01806 [Alteromonadaceae bacterium Bs31]